MNEPFEAGFEVDGFQNGLAVSRSGKHGAGNQIHDLFGIGELIEIAEHILGGDAGRRFDRLAFGNERKGQKQTHGEALGQKLTDFGEQTVHDSAVAGRRFQRADALDTVGPVADWFLEFDASQALQDEMRTAVLMSDRNADQAQPRDWRRSFPGASGFLHGDGKHAIGIERIGEHAPVAGFKNVKWQQRLWKESGIRKSHDRDFLRQLHCGNLSADVIKSRAHINRFEGLPKFEIQPIFGNL